MEYIRACGADEMGEGQMRRVVHGDRKILVANLGGRIYATDATCTHADADLAGGFLSPEGVRCPLHLSVFCLSDGVPQNPPAEEPLCTYNVKIENGDIYVEA